MGFFDSIKNAIFGAPKEEAALEASPVQTASPVIAGTAAKPAAAAPTPVAAATSTPAAPAPAATTASTTPAEPTTPAAPVDVTAILDKAVADSGQKLDWRKSIVDLLKALNIDSSLAARKELAAELGYTGDTGDSAAMNIWLHKEVIAKLKANGGIVPADLL